MKYLYKGPPSGVTLQDGEDKREVLLHTGREVDLPEDHAYTKTLVALQHLISVPQSKSPKAPQRAAGDEPALKGA